MSTTTGTPPTTQLRLYALKVPSSIPEDTLDRLLHHLPEHAQARVRKFRHEADAIRSVAGRLLPTWYLRTERGVSASETVFKHRARGKPYLASPALKIDFNTSHEGAYVVLAVVSGDEGEDAGEVDVGVDVMDLPTDPDELYEAISYQLTVPERLAVSATSGRAKAQLLTTLWTLKEGFTKATGDGITFGLERIAVTTSDDEGREAVSVAVDGRDVREDGWSWSAGSMDGGAYGYAVIWRGGGGAGGVREMGEGGREVRVEKIAWETFVSSFIGTRWPDVA